MNEIFSIFLAFSGTSRNSKNFFKVSCEGACKNIDIQLDATDGDPDLCVRYENFQ